jgi:hypothetical protein
LLERYLDKNFYDHTYRLYVPLLSLFHMPLNMLILYNLFLDEGVNSPFAPYLRLIVLLVELVSLFSQFLFCFYVLIFSDLGTTLIMHHHELWRKTYAALGFCSLLFFTNDFSALLTVVYMNRPGLNTPLSSMLKIKFLGPPNVNRS